MEKQKKSDNGELLEGSFVVPTKTACIFFGISRETLSAWGKKGAPKEARGKWDLKKLVEWRYTGGQIESPETRKTKAEADLKEAKAAQEKIKLGKARQEFLAVEEIRAETTRLLMNLKKSLLAIGHNVASNLASLDADAAEIARNEVDKRIKEALEEMSRGRVYSGKKKGRKAL